MTERLDDIYHKFYEQTELPELKQSVKESHKIISNRISKEDRKIVLRIIDALERVTNY